MDDETKGALIFLGGVAVFVLLMATIITTHRSTMACTKIAGEMKYGSCWINR